MIESLFIGAATMFVSGMIFENTMMSKVRYGYLFVVLGVLVGAYFLTAAIGAVRYL